MKLLSRRTAAIALAGAVALAGSMTTAEAKTTPSKRAGIVKIRVTNSDDANICASIWVDTVVLQGPGRVPTKTKPNRSYKTRNMTLVRTSSVVDSATTGTSTGKDAICTVEYRHRNFSAGTYTATFTVKCAEGSEALCNGDTWSVNGTTAISAPSGSGVASYASTVTPAGLTFSKSVKIKLITKVNPKTKVKTKMLQGATLQLTQLAPPA